MTGAQGLLILALTCTAMILVAVVLVLIGYRA